MSEDGGGGVGDEKVEEPARSAEAVPAKLRPPFFFSGSRHSSSMFSSLSSSKGCLCVVLVALIPLPRASSSCSEPDDSASPNSCFLSARI